MRLKFNEIFHENEDGSLTPKKHIILNSASIGPSITFKKGVSFGGINIFDFKNLDIEVEKVDDGALKINGFYK